MSAIRHLWAWAALSAATLGIGASLLLGGALGTPAATGASPTAADSASAGLSGGQIFGCRASVDRYVAGGQTVAEPAVANPAGVPCADDNQGMGTTGLLGAGSPLNLGTIGPAGATTEELGSLGGAVAPQVTAIANVNALSLTIPGTGYTLTAAGPLEAQAFAYCSGTQLMANGTANLDALTITGPGLPAGGEQVELGSGINQVVGNLGPLAALVQITADEQDTSTPGQLTERLLDVKLLADNADIKIGEATVTVPNSAICADNVPGGGSTTTVTTGGGSDSSTTITGAKGAVTTVSGGTTTIIEPSGSVPGDLLQCTDGSVYDPRTNTCVLYADGQTIFVSQPFKGPSGGQVISLQDAKKKYHSPCFSGPGPKWVLLVTRKGAHAKGTPLSDRILGIGASERISGLAGNDCIDEHGGGHEVITDMNGNDRAYSVKGYTRIAEGNGNDRIDAENGSGWITAGNGKDTVYGGKGRERIDVGLNTDHIYTYRSWARIYDLSQYGSITCGNRTDQVYARRLVAAYALKHGCRKINRVR